MLIQLLVSMCGVIAFALLFGVPAHHWLACGVTGAVSWGLYVTFLGLGIAEPLAAVLATAGLTLVARIFAVVQMAPTTIYLLCGIFPLVPGAGIYYMAYHLIMSDFGAAAEYGSATLKTALAIAIGIILGSSVPQRWFGLFRRKKRK